MEYSYILINETDAYPEELRSAVFTDTRGNVEFPEFQRLLSVVQPGDTINVPTLTDLGYNLTQVSEKWQKLQERKVKVRILDCPPIHNQAGLFGEFLRYVAYSQKKFCKTGPKGPNGHKSGVGPGRRRIQMPQNFMEIYEDYVDGKLNSRQAAQSLNVSHTTFLRWSRQLNEA